MYREHSIPLKLVRCPQILEVVFLVYCMVDALLLNHFTYDSVSLSFMRISAMCLKIRSGILACCHVPIEAGIITQDSVLEIAGIPYSLVLL